MLSAAVENESSSEKAKKIDLSIGNTGKYYLQKK
jgi:hypothetical protein